MKKLPSPLARRIATHPVTYLPFIALALLALSPIQLLPNLSALELAWILVSALGVYLALRRLYDTALDGKAMRLSGLNGRRELAYRIFLRSALTALVVQLLNLSLGLLGAFIPNGANNPATQPLARALGGYVTYWVVVMFITSALFSYDAAWSITKRAHLRGMMLDTRTSDPSAPPAPPAPPAAESHPYSVPPQPRAF